MTASLKCDQHPACWRLTFACHHPTVDDFRACPACQKRMRALGVAP